MVEQDEDQKTYAKILKKEAPTLSLNDLTFFPIDYILRCVEGNYQGKQVRMKDLGDEFVIGEDDSCDLSVKSSDLDAEHTKFKCIRNTVYYEIADCNTRTGTWKFISNLEDYYELKNEYTEFLLFQHRFCIELKENKHYLRFIDSPNNNISGMTLDDGCNLLIGKIDCIINLDIPSTENHKFIIRNNNGKVHIINKTEEVTNEGLFYKINPEEKNLIRAGDVLKLGNLTFRVLVHNWGYTTELGHKNKQEDKFCIIDDLRIFEDVVVPIYAVYDGHGGFACSIFLQKHFHKNLRDIIKLKKLTESKNILMDLADAVQDAIIYTDFSFYENFTSYNQGSTCVLLIFIANRVVCCNLGDSLAILYKKDNSKIFLSKDFKPQREKEQERIKSKGGTINKAGRLLDEITVSRGFGDWRFKDPKNKDAVKKLHIAPNFGDYTMSNRAEMRIFKIDPATVDYVIIVSDGVFQYSSFQSVFDIINTNIISEKEDENETLPSIPSVADKVRLDIINKIHGNFVKKNSITADNMTLILVHLNNDPGVMS